ncbi:ATP-binding protein [Streptomyces sp. ARC32]
MRSGEELILIREGAWPDCPYLGLAPFLQQHARVFYGRDTLAKRLIERLMTRLPQGMLVVVGASGAGKSSLLQAGMLPLLARGELGRWPVLSMTPTGQPLRELAHGLARMAGVDVVSVDRSLRDDPQAAPQLIEQVIRATRTHTDQAAGIDTGPGGGGRAPRLVLVIDQLEELFTLAQESEQSREGRAAFLAALRAATTPAEQGGVPAAMVVAAVRGDFLDQALRFPLLAEAIDAEVFAITPMSERELRSAVTGPAAEADLGIDEAVVDAVVAEVRSGDPATEGFGAGVLPLVSQAMYAAWGHCEPGGELDLRAYRRGGGTTDAVNRSAQRFYENLPPERQKIAGTVFTLLTIVAPDGRLARRRLSIVQLRAACTADPAEVDAVVEAFAVRRLLVTDGTGVEIAHDVLLTSWHQLTMWLEGDRLDRALHSQLLTDTTTWIDHDKHKAYLYPPARLAKARAAADRWTADPERYPQPTAAAAEFLLAGHRAARRGTRIRRALIAVLAFLSVLAVLVVRNGLDDRDLQDNQDVQDAWAFQDAMVGLAVLAVPVILVVLAVLAILRIMRSRVGGVGRVALLALGSLVALVALSVLVALFALGDQGPLGNLSTQVVLGSRFALFALVALGSLFVLFLLVALGGQGPLGTRVALGARVARVARVVLGRRVARVVLFVLLALGSLFVLFILFLLVVLVIRSRE